MLAVLALYLLAQQEGFGISNHGLKEKDQDLIKPSHVRSDDDDEGDEAGKQRQKDQTYRRSPASAGPEQIQESNKHTLGGYNSLIK